MADSEVKSLVVSHPQGQRELLKDQKSGKFVKKPKKAPKDTREVTQYMRDFLSTQVATGDTLDRSARSRLLHILENMADIATFDSSNVCVGVDKDGNAIYGPDAKMAMASVKAAELLMLRAYGKPAPSSEEMDALKRSGVRIVVVEQPQIIHPEVQEEKPRAEIKPVFIEAEVVSTNEPQK